MKVRLIPERCKGFGICSAFDPEYFELDQEYRATQPGPVPSRQESRIRTIVGTCPNAALVITEGA